MSEVVLCDICFRRLKKKHPYAAHMWVDLCEVDSATDGIFGIKRIYNPALRVLEMNKFLVTSENKEMIMIKVTGKKTDSLGEFFCGGLCG